MRLLFTMIILMPIVASCQYVSLHFNDGTTEVYDILDIISARSNSTEFTVSLVDGSTNSWNLSDLYKVDHSDISTGITQGSGIDLDIVIYPNPFSDLVWVELPTRTEAARISITDNVGRVVYYFEIKDPTIDYWNWDGTDGFGKKLPDGRYILHWADGLIDLSQTVLLQN